MAPNQRRSSSNNLFAMAEGSARDLAACLENLGVRDARIVELVDEVENLHAMAEHRSVIEQAKGVIMSTAHCSQEAAFALLVSQSQTQNRKLRDIAAEIAAMQDR